MIVSFGVPWEEAPPACPGGTDRSLHSHHELRGHTRAWPAQCSSAFDYEDEVETKMEYCSRVTSMLVIMLVTKTHKMNVSMTTMNTMMFLIFFLTISMLRVDSAD